jgi:hypothetical protein
VLAGGISFALEAGKQERERSVTVKKLFVESQTLLDEGMLFEEREEVMEARGRGEKAA